MKAKTHIAFVIDRSGSMAKIRQTAVDGFNRQLEEIKENSKEQDITVSLVTFDQDVYENIWNETAEKIKQADPDSFRPNGWTALYDGIGYTVNKLMKTTDINDENSQYLVFIITDGEENQSKHYTLDKIQSLIKECKESKRWTFTYMGCNKESVEEATKTLGIDLGNAAVWSNDTIENASFAFGGVAKNTRTYLRSRSRGSGQSVSFMSSDAQLCSFAGPQDNPVVNIDEGVPTKTTSSLNNVSPVNITCSLAAKNTGLDTYFIANENNKVVWT